MSKTLDHIKRRPTTSFVLPSYADKDSPIAQQLLKLQSLSEQIVNHEKQLQRNVDVLISSNAKFYGILCDYCLQFSTAWKKCRDIGCKNDTKQSTCPLV